VGSEKGRPPCSCEVTLGGDFVPAKMFCTSGFCTEERAGKGMQGPGEEWTQTASREDRAAIAGSMQHVREQKHSCPCNSHTRRRTSTLS
jgi:hypothetical protein